MESHPYAVDYIDGNKWHHTVVMAPGGLSAKQHVLASHPNADVRKVQRVKDAEEARKGAA